jgi:hypothetical protein
MPIENRTLIEKADFAISDLTTDGGFLAEVKAKQFIQTMIKQAKLSAMINVTALDSINQYVDSIRFADQVLYPGTPGVALPDAQRSKPTTNTAQWAAKLFKAEVRLNNAVLEQSIERGNLKNTIMTTLSKAVGRDAEKVLIQGDTTSADPLLAQIDGILKKATSNVVAGGSARLDADLLDAMVRALPKEFIGELQEMLFMTSVNAQLDYSRYLESRGTQLGDTTLENGGTPRYHKVKVEDFSLFPETGFPGANETNVLLGHPKNIDYGIFKKVRVETGKDVSAGVMIMVVETWFDVIFVEETSVVKATAVLNS